MSIIEFFNQAARDMAKEIPGFISISYVKIDDGTELVYYSTEGNKTNSRAPFHLRIYKEAQQSLDLANEEQDSIEEVVLSTQKRQHLITSRTRMGIVVTEMNIAQANLAMARLVVTKYSVKLKEKMAELGLASL